MITHIAATFFIIVTLSVINLVVNIAIYFASQNRIYLQSALFWLLLTINFYIQSQSQADEFLIILGYGFTIFPMTVLCRVTLQFCNRALPDKLLLTLPIFALLLTLILKNIQISFTLKALPFSLVAMIPPLFAVYVIVVPNRAKSTPLLFVHSFVLILLAIHSLNFALYRMKPGSQVWGWSIAYGLYQVLTVLIPAMTLDFNHREEEARLKKIIDARTKELVDANKNLSDLVQQKQFLFRTLSHDIINPLTAMHTRLELASHSVIEREPFLNSMTKLLNKILRLIQQLRTFDNTNQITKEMVIKEYRLLECIDEMADLFEHRLRGKNIRLVYNREEMRNCFVRIDHDSFTNSVLPNIISNSIKFSEPGGEISVTVKKGSTGHIILSVRDSGIGMSKEVLERVARFETNVTKQGTQGELGTGSGIPILSRIINAYGGEMEIISQEKSHTQPGYTLIEIKLLGTFFKTSDEAA